MGWLLNSLRVKDCVKSIIMVTFFVFLFAAQNLFFKEIKEL